jgi:hypothetical protein
MGINAADSRAMEANTLQPTTTSQSKAAEVGQHQHQHQNAMATIADDDDRLLVRIGYTPVSAP